MFILVYWIWIVENVHIKTRFWQRFQKENFKVTNSNTNNLLLQDVLQQCIFLKIELFVFFIDERAKNGFCNFLGLLK
jgi:hypothetical protein